MKRKIPIYLDEQEQDLLLSQPDLKYTKNGLRNYCMMLLMLKAGLRCAEVLNLEITDINWSSGELKIREGKGQKDRIVWLNETIIDFLRNYLEKKQDRQKLLFSSKYGNHVDSSYLRKMVKRYAKKAGIEKDIHPHTLRHTFATYFYRKTKNIRMLQKILGHSDISTTQIYTHIVDHELEEEMKNFNKTEDLPT